MKTEISETMKQVKQVRKEIWRECLKESNGTEEDAYRIYQEKNSFGEKLIKERKWKKKIEVEGKMNKLIKEGKW